MLTLLIIDDEPIYQKMIAHAVKPLNFNIKIAGDGEKGLRLAKESPPDIIICDVMMPDLSGYQVVERMRRDPRLAHTPIIILTVQSEIESKIKALEVGADVHLGKPFVPEELLAEIKVLMRRTESTKSLQNNGFVSSNRIIAFHSLRGGTGCTSLAVNLALGFVMLWKTPTILMDLDLTVGCVSLYLNSTQKISWSDLSQIKPLDLGRDELEMIICHHDSGLDYIAAPAFPADGELVTENLVKAAHSLLSTDYTYMICDLPHNFNDISLYFLDQADVIISTINPEMASVRAAYAALNTYKRLGYDLGKIKIVLNTTFEGKALSRKSIENTLHHPVDVLLPFGQNLFVDAINYGRPIILTKTAEAYSSLLEDFAYKMSTDEHRLSSPKDPSPTLIRVSKRLSQRA
jgi:pilus assembly protein CpaE